MREGTSRTLGACLFPFLVGYVVSRLVIALSLIYDVISFSHFFGVLPIPWEFWRLIWGLDILAMFAWVGFIWAFYEDDPSVPREKLLTVLLFCLGIASPVAYYLVRIKKGGVS